MGGMIRILFPLIGYFCVATVITLTAGYGYLRSSGALSDETMFQIVSLIHGIDLDEVAAASEADAQDVPPEEMSFEDRQQHMRMGILHLQSKKDDIEKNIAVFQAERVSLDNKFRHLNSFRKEVEDFLKEKRDRAAATGLASVRDQWKTLDPETQTKTILKNMIRDEQMDVVIDLLNGLTPKTRSEILNTLNTDDDIAMLYRIEQQMLNGGPEATFIDKKLNELDQTQN